ncbi:MAG: hypothetical protein HY788_01600 [Deltaproteobacteria bacterium]|nr:hypothetical protein [Deltaproteobacteria bacterium]
MSFDDEDEKEEREDLPEARINTFRVKRSGAGIDMMDMNIYASYLKNLQSRPFAQDSLSRYSIEPSLDDSMKRSFCPSVFVKKRARTAPGPHC